MNWRWIGNFMLLGAILTLLGLGIGVAAVAFLAWLFPGADVRVVLVLIFLGMGGILVRWVRQQRP